MEDHDDWKLGDEGDVRLCPGCGKRTRPGLTYCVVCGRSLADELESDPEALRTIGEAMGGRPPRRQTPRGPSLRGWSIAAGVLLLVVVVLTWLQTREEPFRLEDWSRGTPPAPTARPVVATPTALPTAVPTVTPHPTATAVATVAAVVEPTPLPPTATRVRAVRTPASRPTRRPQPVVVPPVLPSPVERQPEREPEEAPTPIDHPRSEATEKPSLGSDLQEATQAYRQAVDAHNAKVDEYNAVADEIQRRNAWDDSEESVTLRRRLDRAREAVESARVQAELLRARMESVRSRYR